MDFYGGKPADANLFIFLLAKKIASASFLLSLPKTAVLRSGLESQ